MKIIQEDGKDLFPKKENFHQIKVRNDIEQEIKEELLRLKKHQKEKEDLEHSSFFYEK